MEIFGLNRISTKILKLPENIALGSRILGTTNLYGYTGKIFSSFKGQ